jgi:broad specificity phosphatase PhoE
MNANSPVTTRLLLVRHGQTDMSVDDAFCGVSDVSLTPMGFRQAKALAERLRRRHVDVLYCSPQKRALETATPIATALGLEIYTHDALREMDFGLWENRARAELIQEYPQLMDGWECGLWMGNPPGGESRQAVIARVVPFVIGLLNTHEGQTIMLVSHRTTLRLLTGHMLDMALSSSRRMQVSPTSLTELHVTGNQVQILFYNDTAHLDSLNDASSQE